jgi:hypothetical protein
MKVKFLLLMPLMILAQEWSAVTAIKEFDGLKYYDGAIYAASKGGLLKISESGTYTYLNRVNGLAGTRVRNMATKNDQFYVLTENNALSILENNVWSTPTSVAIDEWEDFYVDDSEIWISYSGGIILYTRRDGEWQFQDFFNQFPVALSNNSKTPLVWQDQILIFNENIVYYASNDYRVVNLKDAGNWSVNTLFQSGEYLTDRIVFNGNAYLATNRSVYQLSGLQLTSLTAGLSSTTNGFFSTFDNNLYFHAGGQISQLQGNSWVPFLTLSAAVLSFDKMADLLFVNALEGDIVAIELATEIADTLQINRPVGERFRQFASDKDGNLYAATTGFYGRSPDQPAFMIGDSWRSFKMVDSHFSRFGNTVLSVTALSSGQILWGTYGRGIYVQNGPEDFAFINRSGPRTVQMAINNETYSFNNDASTTDLLGFVGVDSDTTYTIVHDMFADNSNRLWIANHLSHKSTPLVCVELDAESRIPTNPSSWHYFPVSKYFPSGEFVPRFVGPVFVDIFDNVWVGDRYEGIVRFNFNGTLANQSDDTGRLFVPGAEVLSIGSDQNGTMYVGTTSGLFYISGNDEFAMVGDASPVGSRISGIARDGYNNLWFATENGVSFLEADAYPFDPEAWHHFTTENSDLLDNFCYGIFVDTDRNRVLIGTDKGISIFKSRFLPNRIADGQLTLGPNPFRPANGRSLLISGAGVGATIRILTVSGRLIKNYNPDDLVSGSVSWDGKNMLGDPVASGVYVVYAVDQDGTSHKSKLMVIR